MCVCTDHLYKQAPDELELPSFLHALVPEENLWDKFTRLYGPYALRVTQPTETKQNLFANNVPVNSSPTYSRASY